MFEIKEITSQLASELIVNCHYSHRTPQIIYAYGLYENGVLTGCVTYGRPPTPQIAKSVYPDNIQIVYELNRLVITSKTPNAASYLVGNSLKLIGNGLIIVSYADTAYGHVGYIYQATNFYYAGEVKAHDAEYIWNNKKYHPRVLHHMGISNPTQWAKDNGAEKLPILSKHRYVYVTGTKYQKNNILKSVKWELSKDYPKGDTQRHEANFVDTQMILSI